MLLAFQAMLIQEFENWPVSNSQSVRKGHIRLSNWEFQGASKKAIEKGLRDMKGGDTGKVQKASGKDR